MVRLRFGTFNLLNGLAVESGAVREADLRAAAAALDTDVLAMQEVDRGQPRSHKVDQAAVVADALGAAWWRFAPALTGVPARQREPADPLSDPAGPAFGIAVVSRLPVLSWAARAFAAAPVRLPLRIPGRRGLVPVADQPRVALAAVIVGPDGPFTVAATHLSFVPGWNLRQLRAITGWMASMPPPRILLGDLNLPGPVPALATRWTQLARVPTYPAWRPRVQWDHILAQGIGHSAVLAVSAQRLPISDHAALTADLQW